MSEHCGEGADVIYRDRGWLGTAKDIVTRRRQPPGDHENHGEGSAL
jgi:hypothetical protein